MTAFTDDELLLRLHNCEDAFVERKTVSDSKDWLKTVVAFANSVPDGYPAVLFIGVKNDGTVQEHPTNLDRLQITLATEINKAYPPVYYLPRVLSEKGRKFLAVIVPGSPERPHFAGQAFVREGSQSVVASQQQFAKLIHQRQSKAYEILKWQAKQISWEMRNQPGRTRYNPVTATVVDCNQFYVTLGYSESDTRESIPLSRVQLSYDHANKRLKLELHEA